MWKPRVRRRLIAAVLLPLLWGLALPVHAAGALALAPGDEAPPLKGSVFPKRTRWVTDWSESKLTLVNFWATWCLPCRNEMPILQRLADRYPEEALRVVGVFELWETEKVQSFLDDVGVTYPNIRADKVTDRLWRGVAVKPTSFLVSQEGKILRRYIGATPETTRGLMDDIQAVLEGREMDPQVLPKVSFESTGSDEP